MSALGSKQSFSAQYISDRSADIAAVRLVRTTGSKISLAKDGSYESTCSQTPN